MPLGRGAYCDLWKGELYGREVAIHTTVLLDRSVVLLVSQLNYCVALMCKVSVALI